MATMAVIFACFHATCPPMHCVWDGNSVNVLGCIDTTSPPVRCVWRWQCQYCLFAYAPPVEMATMSVYLVVLTLPVHQCTAYGHGNNVIILGCIDTACPPTHAYGDDNNGGIFGCIDTAYPPVHGLYWGHLHAPKNPGWAQDSAFTLGCPWMETSMLILARSKAELGSHFTVHHLLSWTQSYDLEA